MMLGDYIMYHHTLSKGTNLCQRHQIKIMNRSTKIIDSLLTCVIQIAGRVNRCIREMGLRDLGQLEQDLVFGDAGTKEVINYLRMHQVMDH